MAPPLLFVWLHGSHHGAKVARLAAADAVNRYRSFSSTRRSRAMKSNKGFTLIELLIVVAIIGIIAAIAIPGLMRARMAGNEASAIGSLRAINSAQATYASSAAAGGYAISLVTLATPCNGVGQGFISLDLSLDPSVKSGYTVTLAVGANGVALVQLDCNGTASQSNYYATAVSVTLGSTGSRGFATNGTATIWQDTAGGAPAEAAFAVAGTISVIQ
jgi:prepilin-type N-terminal cleavage/methylation domain-containing protein